MGFWKELITDGSGLSSKRFISMIGMVVFIGMIILAAVGITIPEVFVYIDATLIIGNQSLTLFNKKVDGKSAD